LKDFARDTLGAEWEEGARELLFKLLCLVQKNAAASQSKHCFMGVGRLWKILGSAFSALQVLR